MGLLEKPLGLVGERFPYWPEAILASSERWQSTKASATTALHVYLLQDSKIVHPVAMRLSPDSQPFMSDSMTASAYSGLAFSCLIFTLCCLRVVKFAAHTASFVLSVFSQYILSCKGRKISIVICVSMQDI